MLTLYFFSDSLIAIIGGVNYLILYFLALVLGNALSLYFYRRQPYYTAVGASGAVVGILYSFILFEPQARILVFILPMPAYLFGIAYLLYSLYGMKAKSDNIGHSAHFGGAIAGFAFTLFIYPELCLSIAALYCFCLSPSYYFLYCGSNSEIFLKKNYTVATLGTLIAIISKK